MNFHKPLITFYKSCNEIDENHFGLYDWEWELEEYLFKISSKSEMAQFFEKAKKTVILTLCAEIQIFPEKWTSLSFSRLKISSHMQKNFEKSNKEILKKVVNRQTFAQTILALDDPCFIYDIAS